MVLTENHNPFKDNPFRDEVDFVGIVAKYEKKERGYRLHLCPGGCSDKFDTQQIQSYMAEAIETLISKDMKITSIAGSIGRHPGETIGNFQKWQQSILS